MKKFKVSSNLLALLVLISLFAGCYLFSMLWNLIYSGNVLGVDALVSFITILVKFKFVLPVVSNRPMTGVFSKIQEYINYFINFANSNLYEDQRSDKKRILELFLRYLSKYLFSSPIFQNKKSNMCYNKITIEVK